MKRLFVSAALLPLALASAARAETHITTTVATPLKTSTANGGAPDDLTIDAGGTVKPTTSGAAVTLDSNNKVTNNGSISFSDVDNATAVLVQGGHTGSVTNAGAITVNEDNAQPDTDNDGFPDGPAAVGSTRFGIHVLGADGFTGDINNTSAGSITIKGNDSAGISVETQLTGNLINSGTVNVTGDRTVGILTQHVTGNVQVLGAVTVTGAGAQGVVLGDVDGRVQLQSAITTTGYKTTSRLDDASRAKLDADDLQQGGSTVAITGNVGGGVLLDKPPVTDPNNADVDGDGIPDAQEGTAALTSFGAAPALDVGSVHATTLSVVGTGNNAYGIVNNGTISGQGVNDGVGATALRIGQVGGGTTTVVGGVNNIGSINAAAFGADVKANGGDATAILINANGVAPAVVNAGTISATLTGGSQNAAAIVDKSGTVALVDNIGTISAVVTPATGSTAVGEAIAIDARANTAGLFVRQTLATATSTPAIVGDVLLGSGADRVQLSGGAMTGALSFGGGADSFQIDSGGIYTGALTETGGNLAINVQAGRLALTNVATIQMRSLSVGATGVVAFAVDPTGSTSTRLQVSGPATFADGAGVELNLASVLKAPQSFVLVQAGSLQVGSSTGVKLSDSPFLYAASLNANTATGTLSADFRPKTAAELGLNRSGSEAYSAILANLDVNPNVANAFLSEKTQAGFQSLYDQLLPDHSGGSLMSAAAISSAISQAVGQALPHDGQGGGALWAQEIAFHIDRDRDQALGFNSQGYGLAAGVEMVGEANALGLDGSFVTTTYKDQGAAVGERIVMNFAEGGGYWRLRSHGFQADARLGLGYVWFDSDRELASPTLAETATAKWSGWLVDAHAGASYTMRFGGFYARPEASIDYIHLNEGGYQESGGGPALDLNVDSRTGDLLTAQGLVALGWQFGDVSWWAPEVKLGWRDNISGAPGTTTARFQGGSSFTLDPETPTAGGAIVRLGIKGGSDQIFVDVDGGGTFDSGSREYDLRGTVRFRF